MSANRHKLSAPRGMRIGIHTSTAKSLERAAVKAHELGANCFQIFSTSPRMWRASVPDPAQVALLQRAREKYDLQPLAIHAGYLINLASLDPVIRARSVDAFAQELARAEIIGAEYLVVHPGNAKGRSRDEAIAACVLAIKDAAEFARPRRVAILLENTVGAGGQLGGQLNELASIRDLAGQLIETPIGYCLDTCHLLAAGFEIRRRAALDATLQHIEATLGLAHVRLFHANDSKTPLGSHVDRHENIGEGHIGDEGFRTLLTHPKLKSKPFILETPVDEEGDDRRNVERLQRLAGVRRA